MAGKAVAAVAVLVAVAFAQVTPSVEGAGGAVGLVEECLSAFGYQPTQPLPSNGQGESNQFRPQPACKTVAVATGTEDSMSGGGAGQRDSDRDGVGDEWSKEWTDKANQLIEPFMDLDDDGLGNVDEFRWQLVPVCVAEFGNCMDHEGDIVTGLGGDSWLDGEEVAYWNDPDNDARLFALGNTASMAFFDPDRTLDTDGDGQWNINETDSDDDGLIDGDEAKAYGSYPEFRDSDCSLLATQCTASWDTWYWDPERVGFPGAGDGLDDLVELAYWNTLGPDAWQTDYDGDGIANNLLDSDADGDGLLDGEEVLVWDTKPHAVDSDLDGLLDGLEVSVGSSPLVVDTDQDGLSDYDEVVTTGTDPSDRDTDNDGLSDYEEVVVYGYKYDPHEHDTDGDGQSDGVEVALTDTNGDFDGDGLKNGDESTYGTDPTRPDSDCDGVKDGPERRHWGSSWNTGGNRLLDPDVDGDGIKDGVELGTTGTPNQVFYRTQPHLVDSDFDGLSDGEEARNDVDVGDCEEAQQMSSSSSWWGEPLPYAPLPSAPLAGLTSVDGLLVGFDGAWYVQGGYGVKLYLNTTLPSSAMPADVVEELLEPQQSSAGAPAAGSNGHTTHPELPDTDGDGLIDGEEVSGSRNPYKGQKWNSAGPGGNTNPANADSDGDTIPDGVELGVNKWGGTVSNAWVSNPNAVDTDGDDLRDNDEDPGRADGTRGLEYNSHTGVWAKVTGGAASSPVDADTDDDGIMDVTDPDPRSWDMDGDGLSDGLETGVTSPVFVNGVVHTVSGKNVLGLSGWPTFQPFPTQAARPSSYLAGGVPITTEIGVRDTDGDGIIDGLEDLNHNGVFGDSGEVLPNVADSDGDGLVDGRELLFFGTYSFQTFIQARGSPLVGTSYNNHPFMTDPLLPSTDGDGILDGKDIDPKGNGLLLLQMGMFWQHDRIDKFGPDWGTISS